MLNPADPAFLARLEALLPPDTLRAPDARYLEEPRGRWHGHAGAVALPRSTDKVAVILRACQGARVGVVPWGGGTGLVGGQIMPDGPAPLLVSLERMAALRGAYPEENVLVVEAGMTLADVQAQAETVDRLFPLSLASEGSCRIGGNLATNAGGLGVLRYGNTRDLCLGVEAVLADGSIFNGLKRLRKDNTGYDLRHLLIGSEGSLGGITAASLRLYPPPAAGGPALLAGGRPKGGVALAGWGGGASGGHGLGLRACSPHGAGVSGRNHARGPQPAGRQPRLDGADRDRHARGFWPRSPASGGTVRGRDGRGSGVGWRDCHLRGAARRPVAHPRVDPRGEPPDRLCLKPRHLVALGRGAGFHRTGRGGAGGDGGFPGELLWPSGRRKPALQRLPRAGAITQRL